MARSTIDFGIDLGTTNSAIAVLKGVKPEVIKSNLDTDITRSAVYIGKQGKVMVGMRVMDKLVDDRSAEDVYIEFKRRMGGDSVYNFKSAGITKTPEEVSAEVLKSLKGNVQQRLDEDIKAAVITIPAAFAQRQCMATKKAAELAGFTQCPLLQEPVAASLAYGFQADMAKKSFWLVFDFGGGTFDAAVMKAEDGDIQVVNHGGDNFLGGADIDWGIIENIIIPHLNDNYNLPDFKRGNAHWRSALAKIKRSVEFAKIDLSRQTETTLEDCVFEDDDGNEVELDGFKLTQNQLSDIAEPLIERAVEKCKAVLAEKNLSTSAIEKTILVGGPTLAPYFRDILSDKLGVELDHSVDPLTVVAQGAAVFAGTQRIDKATRNAVAAPVATSTHKLSLNYKPIGPDDDPKVTGEVLPPSGGSVAGCTIEFTNRKTKWSSGAIPLNDEGKFVLRLSAEAGDQNIFDIALMDSTGTKLPCDTTEIPYTIGATIKAQTVCSDISIGLDDNKVIRIVQKGTEYPFKKTTSVTRTNKTLKRGEKTVIEIPVLEAMNGDYGRLADHNRKLGQLFLSSESLKHDLPLGSDVEVTISAKEPGHLKIEAYIPLIDEAFSTKIEIDKKAGETEDELRAGFAREKARLSKMLEKADSAQENGIHAKVDEIDSLWVRAGEVEGSQQLQVRIIELRMKLDEIEEQAKVPEKIEEIEYALEEIEKFSDRQTSAQRSEVANVKERLDKQRVKKNVAELDRLKEDCGELYRDVMRNQPEHWKGLLSYEYQHRNEMSDTDEANRLFEQGSRAIKLDDLDGMRKAALRLLRLLPRDVQENANRGVIGQGFSGLTAD